MMEVEVWLVVNADEEYETFTDEDEANGHGLSGPCRIVKITVAVPVPKAVEVVVTVPDEPTGAAVQVG